MFRFLGRFVVDLPEMKFIAPLLRIQHNGKHRRLDFGAGALDCALAFDSNR